ncbi:MAG: glycosyltransferase [Anaerolineaceae bacterium]|nr:glycosyltransferase [Anaerolineaceae bacterium]
MHILAITTASQTSPSPAIQDHLDGLLAYGITYDVYTIHVHNKKSYLKAAQFVAGTMLQRRKYDLIHAFYGHCGLIARAQFTLPVVVTFQGTDILGGIEGMSHARDGQIGRTVSRVVNSAIVMSDQMAQYCHTQPTHVIPFGINTDIFKPGSQIQARAELGLHPNTRYILFPYNPKRTEKRYYLAEAALALVREQIDEDVELLPVFAKPREMVAKYMQASDGFILVSDHEGSPVAVREAIACTLPVVSLDVGDVASIIEQVDHCTIATEDTADIAQKLVEVLKSGERIQNTQAITRMNVDWTVSQIIPIYEEAWGKRIVAEMTTTPND